MEGDYWELDTKSFLLLLHMTLNTYSYLLLTCHLYEALSQTTKKPCPVCQVFKIMSEVKGNAVKYNQLYLEQDARDCCHGYDSSLNSQSYRPKYWEVSSYFEKSTFMTFCIVDGHQTFPIWMSKYIEWSIFWSSSCQNVVNCRICWKPSSTNPMNLLHVHNTQSIKDNFHLQHLHMFLQEFWQQVWQGNKLHVVVTSEDIYSGQNSFNLKFLQALRLHISFWKR